MCRPDGRVKVSKDKISNHVSTLEKLQVLVSEKAQAFALWPQRQIPIILPWVLQPASIFITWTRSPPACFPSPVPLCLCPPAAGSQSPGLSSSALSGCGPGAPARHWACSHTQAQPPLKPVPTLVPGWLSRLSIRLVIPFRVVILRFVGSSPILGSTLNSAEPAWDFLSTCLSTLPQVTQTHSHSLSLSLSFSLSKEINKFQ